MSGPRPELAQFIERSHPGARVEPMAGDASTRRFFRLVLPDGTGRVVMDYGRPFDGETDDVRLARVFGAAGLRVAAIHEVAGEPGCLVLEDLGRTSLETVMRDPDGGPSASALAWLERSVRLAAEIADRGTPALARSDRDAGLALDSARFRFEMEFYVEHYVRGLCGVRPSEALLPELHALADQAAETPRCVLCHRDFHSRNLMVLASGELALVDIQDARWGPDSYDLASILYDAYVEIDSRWRAPLVELYLATLAAPPAPGFATRLDRVAAERMLKALGTFGYQASARGERRYLEGVPRTLRRLRALLPTFAEGSRLFGLLDAAGLLAPR